MENYKQLIRDAFATVVENPQYDEAAIRRYFSPDYVQQVDGKVLSFDQFRQHLNVLKETVTAVAVRFDTLAAENEVVFSNHRVTATRANGQTGEMQVIAEFRIHNGQINACNELTHLIRGDAEDRDLGSRH